MTKQERVKAVIEGRKTDATPYHFDLTLKVRNRLADYYGIETEEVERFIGNHLLYLSFRTPESFGKTGIREEVAGKHESGTYTFDLEEVNQDTYLDEFGVTWDNQKAYETGDWGMVDHPVKDMCLGAYKFPDGKARGRFRGVEAVVRQNPDRFNVLLMVGLLDTAWHVTGIQNLLQAMALEDSNFADKVLDLALEFNLGVIEQIPPYLDGVRFLEDWAGQEGLFMGIKHWRRFLKPRLKEMYGAVKKRGCAVMSHSDGNITELFPELIELGVDVSDCLQPEVMDLAFIKKEYGKDIVLFGGVGCQSTIPRGTPEEVVKEAKERLQLLGEGGKYILGPAGSIPTEAPIENVIALVDFCQGLIGE